MYEQMLPIKWTNANKPTGEDVIKIDGWSVKAMCFNGTTWMNKCCQVKTNAAKPTSYDVIKIDCWIIWQCVWTELDVWPNAVEPASYDVINTDGWSI